MNYELPSTGPAVFVLYNTYLQQTSHDVPSHLLTV